MSKIDGFKFWQEKLNGAKLILAPMVDQSELPWRMISRKYGAQLCYTPMMHSGVFARDPTYRAENFTTCPEDRPLIAQFCSDDPDLFVKAGKLVENECDAIDLNLGCPQNIARRGHYGSFLQDEWQLISDIISKGVENFKVPVTAKIRVFEDIDRTIEYAKMLEKAGVTILTVHGRTREQKGENTGLASWKHIKAVKDSVKIPVFANGNILCYDDINECLKQTGCDGVMVAETNLYNPAIFAKINPYIWDISNEYLDFVEKYPCSFACIRGHIFKIFNKFFEKFQDIRDKASKIKSLIELREIFAESKEICSKDVEVYENDETKKLNDTIYFVCQAYIRFKPNQTKNQEELRRVVEQVISDDTSSVGIKRRLDEIVNALEENNNENEQDKEKQKNLVKLLERKRRKHERIERKLKHFNKYNLKIENLENGNHNTTATANVEPASLNKNKALIKTTKYINCKNCKNPRSDNCEYGLCRACCKNKVFTEEIDCKGHGLKFKRKNSNDLVNNENESNLNLDNKKDTTLDNVSIVNQ